MNERNKILESIGKNKPAFFPLPEMKESVSSSGNLVELFSQVATKVGSRVVMHVDSLELFLENDFQSQKNILSLLPEVEGTLSFVPDASPSDYSRLEVLLLKSPLGVAENGAVWISEKEIPLRILPFIAEHLIIVLDPSDIVPDMLAAYNRVSIRDTGFGVFIGGPSKTADIEQALVVGAQGTRSNTIILQKTGSSG